MDYALQLLERSRPPSGKSAELYAQFTTVSNALSRYAFLVERLEQTAPAADGAVAAQRDRDTAWGVGLGGGLAGSSLREVLSGVHPLPRDTTTLRAVLDRDGA